jgi:hypothetical protein
MFSNIRRGIPILKQAKGECAKLQQLPHSIDSCIPEASSNTRNILGKAYHFLPRFLDAAAQIPLLLRLGVRLTIRELIAEQRRRLASVNPAERLAAALLIPSVLAERLRDLSDFNLGQLLEDEVWSNLNLLAPESTICLVAADRLRQTSRPTKGELTR